MWEIEKCCFSYTQPSSINHDVTRILLAGKKIEGRIKLIALLIRPNFTNFYPKSPFFTCDVMLEQNYFHVCQPWHSVGTGWKRIFINKSCERVRVNEAETKKNQFWKQKRWQNFSFLTHIFLLVLYFHSTGAKIALFRGFSCLTDFSFFSLLIHTECNVFLISFFFSAYF